MSKVKADKAVNSYKKRYALLQGLIVALPTIGGAFRYKPVYVAPPLGTLGDLVSPLAFLLVGLAALVPYFIKSRKLALIVIFCAGVFSLGAAILYAGFVSKSVLEINVTATGSVIRVSVGDQLTDFARHNYPDASAEDMVKDFGHQEEDIQKLWTRSSLQAARMRLLWSYIAFWAMLDICIGSMAKADLLSEGG